MKTLMLGMTLIAGCTALCGAADTKKAPAKTAKAPEVKPLTIPKDAVANPDGTYTWKDAQGKAWRFVQTPFGLMRTAVQTEDGAAQAGDIDLSHVKATEAGDKVLFERMTPFGPTRWEKSKASLTDAERALLTKQTAAPGKSK